MNKDIEEALANLKKELYKIQEVLDAYKQTQEFPDDGVEDY